MGVNFTITNPLNIKNFYNGVLYKSIIFYILYIIILGYAMLFPYSLKDIKMPESRRYTDKEVEKLGYIFKQNYFSNINSLGIFKIKKDINLNIIGISDILKILLLSLYSYSFLFIVYVIITIYVFYIISPLLNYTKLNDTNTMDPSIISKAKYKSSNIIVYIIKLLPVLLTLLIPLLIMLIPNKLAIRSFGAILITFIVILPFLIINGMHKNSVVSNSKSSKNNILNNLYLLLDSKDYPWLDIIISRIKVFYFANFTILLLIIISIVTLAFYNNSSKSIFNFYNIIMFIIICIIIPLYLIISVIIIITSCYDKQNRCDILDGTSLVNLNPDFKNGGIKSIFQGALKYNKPCFMK
jgi:hypothetical protein